MRIPLAGFSFATTVRMIDRIHGNPTHMRPASPPTRTSCFPDTNVLMVDITDLADRGQTGAQNPSHFTGLQADLNVVSISSHNLRKTACTTDELCSLAWLELEIVNRRAQRHVRKRQRIAGSYVGVGARLHNFANP